MIGLLKDIFGGIITVLKSKYKLTKVSQVKIHKRDLT